MVLGTKWKKRKGEEVGGKTDGNQGIKEKK